MDNFEPGAAQHGNFITYYKFHSPKERKDLLPVDLLFEENQEFVCLLDVGCNVGDLTEEVYKEASLNKKCQVLALDIDETLIERAIENNTIPNIEYRCANVVDNHFTTLLENYLSQSNRTRFDVTFLFSVTMWIHLNHGDEGLKALLKIVADHSKMLVVEPQPWKCYKQAVRRLKRAKKEPFPFFSSIKMRNSVEEDIDMFLRETCLLNRIHVSEQTSWGRKIFVYRNPKHQCTLPYRTLE